MFKTILFIFIGIISFQVHADDLSDLKKCRTQCSSSCRTLAAKYKELIEVAQDCTGSDVAARCRARFSGSDAAECAGRGRSVEAIDRCYVRFSGDNAIICAAARSASIVDRCYARLSSNAAAQCAAVAKSVEHVDECYRRYSGEEILKCLGK